jgi:hypothetical protein
MQQLKEIINKGPVGEYAAISYFQGAFDGLIAMESLNRKQGAARKEFCGVFDAQERGQKLNHPAYQTKDLVLAWENEGHPMSAPVVDMVLSYLTSKYGCT